MSRVSRFFNQKDWHVTTSGTGTVTFSDDGKSVVCDASAGNRAYITTYIVAWPGDSFEFTCIAQNLDTGKAGWAEMFIDSPSRADEARVIAETPQQYGVRHEIPLAASGPRYIAFSVGLDSPTDGSARFMLPRIDRVKGDNSFLYATFRADANGGLFVHPTLKSLNIDDSGIIWNATQLRYEIVPTETTTTLFQPNGIDIKPLLIANPNGGRSDTGGVLWNIGGLTTAGRFEIQAVDSSGTRLDLSAGLGRDLFITVKMEL